jgi:ribosome-associated protein
MAQAAWEKKADNPVLLDVGSTSDVTDYFLVCSANSTRGVKTIVDNIEKTLEEAGEKVIGIEGYSDGNWVLIDSADVVHVFIDQNLRYRERWSTPPIKHLSKTKSRKPGVLQNAGRRRLFGNRLNWVE